MMLAARMQIGKRMFGLRKCCVLFVTLYCCMTTLIRFRYCKEQLEEGMTYIKYQEREEKYFRYFIYSFWKNCHEARQIFFSSHNSMFFFLFTTQCKVYVRMILLRNKAIPSELINTNGIRTLSLSLSLSLCVCACIVCIGPIGWLESPYETHLFK
jgi:hypothetical protein